MGLVMELIYNQIASHIEMQKDLFHDGEYPVGLKDANYYEELYKEAEEIPEDLAKLMAHYVAEYANEYASLNRLNTGSIKTVGEYSQLTIWDWEGKVLVLTCYGKDDHDSMVVVHQGISNKYPVVVWL